MNQGEKVNSAQTGMENDRKEIDLIDTRLIEMLRARRRISSRVQQHRLNHGGPRIAPGREKAVIDRYRQALGPDAAALVHDILRLCRGPAPAAAATTDHDEQVS